MDLSSQKIKNNIKINQRLKDRNSALVRRKYTTRQVMELMETRRRQLDPDAVGEPAELSKTGEQDIVPAEPAPEAEERSWTPVVSGPLIPVESALPQRAVTVVAYVDPWHARPLAHVRSFAAYFSEAVSAGFLTAAAFIIFVVMLTHILTAPPTTDYGQAPFVVLAVMLTAWAQRHRLHRGKRSMGLGLIALVGGMVIFSAAALFELAYAELLGFVLTAFGFFCARYSKESAQRLIFPLACLAFAVAPPESLSAALSPKLNILTAQASDFILRFLHIPTKWYGNVFSAGGYEFFLDKDLTVFRLMLSALPLVALCAHYVYRHSRRHLRQWMLTAAALPLAFFAGIIHMTGTGWAAYTYGNPYADGFYQSAAIVLFAVIGIFALVVSVTVHEDYFQPS